MIFTISARSKPKETSVLEYLRNDFKAISLNNIDSIFGFLEKTTLYGGRIYTAPELSDQDVNELYSVKIGLRIPLTNIYIERNEYLDSRPFLEKYHKKNNAVIVTDNSLATWIKKDFPRYKVEASVIKNINSHKKIIDALELYDTVVLPMKLNQDHDFLRAVKNKKRVTLFANAGCALTCPSKICYPSISKINKFQGGDFKCSQTHKYRESAGMIDFDLPELSNLGFTRFKLLRQQPGGMTGY